MVSRSCTSTEGHSIREKRFTNMTILKVTIIISALLIGSPSYANEGFKEGGEKIGAGVKQIGKDTGKAFKEGGKSVGQGFKEIGKETGKETKKAGRSVGDWFKDVGRKTGEAFNQMGKSIKGLFKGER